VAETSLHAELALTLREWLLRSPDIELTHFVGQSPLPDPVKIGRHEPDLLARSRATGRLIIGRQSLVMTSTGRQPVSNSKTSPATKIQTENALPLGMCAIRLSLQGTQAHQSDR
jgi:hypothetical protein